MAFAMRPAAVALLRRGANESTEAAARTLANSTRLGAFDSRGEAGKEPSSTAKAPTAARSPAVFLALPPRHDEACGRILRRASQPPVAPLPGGALAVRPCFVLSTTDRPAVAVAPPTSSSTPISPHADQQYLLDGTDSSTSSQSTASTLTTDSTTSSSLPPPDSDVDGVCDAATPPRLEGDFDTLGHLGRGAFGSVLQVRHKVDQHSYAVKRVPLPVPLAERQEVLAEAQLMARITGHPHVVRYFCSWIQPCHAVWTDASATSSLASQPLSHGSTAGGSTTPSVQPAELCIQMELCGPTLAHWLQHRAPAPQPARLTSARTILRQLLLGVEHLHSHGLEHRDLKPHNVFERVAGPAADNDQVLWCVADFSLSTIPTAPSPVAGSDSSSGSGGNDGGGIGTFLYSPPELSTGCLPLRSRTTGGGWCLGACDIFSLGVLLTELCTPFATHMERAVALQALREGTLPSTLAACPLEAGWVRSMTDPTPARRPSARALLSQLEAAAAPTPPPAAPRTTTTTTTTTTTSPGGAALELVRQARALREQLQELLRGGADVAAGDLAALRYEVSVLAKLVQGQHGDSALC